MKIIKPKKFSCPYSYPDVDDWKGREAELSAILAKDPNELGVKEYNQIYAIGTPAADFEEGCFYFDFCMEYIKRQKTIHETSYPTSILWWIDKFHEKFVTNDLWNSTKNKFKEMLLFLLSHFQLFDLTEAECKKIKRNYDYSIGPYNSKTVCSIFDDLTIYDSFEDVLWETINWLENSENVDQIRWYVEVAFHTRSWCNLYEDDDYEGLENFKRKEQLFHRLHSFRILNKKQVIATEHTFNENKSKYNRLVCL